MAVLGLRNAYTFVDMPKFRDYHCRRKCPIDGCLAVCKRIGQHLKDAHRIWPHTILYKKLMQNVRNKALFDRLSFADQNEDKAQSEDLPESEDIDFSVSGHHLRQHLNADGEQEHWDPFSYSSHDAMVSTISDYQQQRQQYPSYSTFYSRQRNYPQHTWSQNPADDWRYCYNWPKDSRYLWLREGGHYNEPSVPGSLQSLEPLLVGYWHSYRRQPYVSSYDWHHGYTDCTMQAVTGNHSVEKCQQERNRSPHPSCSAVVDYNHRPQIAQHSSSHTTTLSRLPSWQRSDEDIALAARHGSIHTTLSRLPSRQRSDDDIALAARHGSSHTTTLSRLPSWQRSDDDSVSQRCDTFPVVDGAFCPSSPFYSVLSSGQNQPYRETALQNSDALFVADSARLPSSLVNSVSESEQQQAHQEAQHFDTFLQLTVHHQIPPI